MKDPYRIVLGIDLGRDYLRAAEVEHRDEAFFVSRICDRKISGIGVDELVRELSAFVNEEGILSRVASVALDTTLFERDTITVDSDLNQEEISNLLKSEISFHHNFQEVDYRPAYQVLRSTDEGHNEIFYAAIDKGILVAVKDACTRCGLALQFVDLDHSCTEVAIIKLAQQMKNFIVVTVKEGQVEGSFCSEGQRTYYKYTYYSGEPFYFITKMAQDLESLADKYAEKFIVSGHKADSFMIDLLKKSSDSRFELFSLGEKILLSPLVASNEDMAASPHHFASVIGAALK
ncbi:MAG TPA: hypothetical protein VIS48_09725 [Candidatus Kryptonia bacterium]